MAEQNPPAHLQAGSHPAKLDRQVLATLTGSQEGVPTSAALAVTQSGTPGMSVQVAAGACLVKGDQAADQGTYLCYNDAAETVTIAAADATNARKDLIVARVYDNFYAAGSNTWALEAVTGTPAGSPAEPATPNDAIVLAMVDVPALDTAITNAQITDRRTILRSPQARTYGRHVLTADVTGITTTPVQVLTATVTVPAGRKVRIVAKCHFVTATAGTPGRLNLEFQKNSVAHDIFRIDSDGAETGFAGGTYETWDEPAAGSHTYRLVAYTNTGTVRWDSDSAAGERTWLEVVDEGPAL